MPTRAAAEARSFARLLQGHLDSLHERRYSRSAQDHALRVLPWLFTHLRDRGVTDLRAVTEAHVARFARELASHPSSRRGEALSRSTQIVYLMTVRRFFTYLTKRGLILYDPSRELRLDRPPRLPRAALSEAQARRLVNLPDPWTVLGKRNRAVLEILYGTGIRKGEWHRLDISDIDLLHRTLLVRNGKGKKDRLLPIPGRVAAALDVYLRDSRPELAHDPRESALFLSSKLGGSRLSLAWLAAYLRQCRAAARIPGKLSPHDLRHACATHLLRGGADVRHVQKLLGHRRITTTALYTHLVIDDLKRVLRRAHPREKRASGRARRR